MKIDSVFVAIPSYSESIRAEVMMALFNWQRDRNAVAQPESVTVLGGGEANIYRGRDSLAHDFLKSGCSHSLWIDDDMAPAYANIDRLLRRAAQVGAHCLSAAYCTKANPPVLVGQALGRFCGRPASGLQRMALIGFGFVLVSRHAFELVESTAPEYGFGDNSGSIHKLRGFFYSTRPGAGEDRAFCDRLEAAGVEILCDIDNWVSHVGRAEYPLRDALGNPLARMSITDESTWQSPKQTPVVHA